LISALPAGVGLGLGLLALTAGGLVMHLPGQQGIGSPERIAGFVAFALGACMLYGRAVILSLQGRIHLAVVIGVAVALRALVLPAPPFLSTDLYRYVWDGRVQRAGINPYIYVPAAPELQSLREAILFPNINRPDYARTIYPPVAQMIFRLVATVAESPYAMKTAMVIFDTITISVLIVLLKAAGKPPAQALIYAWHPLPVWEFAGNAHVDAAAISFISVALLAAFARRPAVASLALAGAVLVKLLPAILVPVIWRRSAGGWPAWRGPALFAAAIVAAYACYADAGWHVFGFLSGYAEEEGIASETRLYPLALLSRVVALPHWAGAAYFLVVALGLLVIGAVLLLRKTTPMPPTLERLGGGALWLTTLLTVALSPHYPWYFTWLLVPCCLRPSIAVIYLTSAAFLIYLAVYDDSVLWPSLIYVPFALLALRDFVSVAFLRRTQRS